jgi:hypothetical protein
LITQNFAHAVAATVGDIVMVDGHKNSNEVLDPTIHAAWKF